MPNPLISPLRRHPADDDWRKIGDLRSILALAMANAITDRDDTGSEIITQEHLVGVGQIGVA